MNQQVECWQLAQQSIQNKIPAMLLYVLESLGSSPGRQGFFMVANARKQMCGSIGGGIMEHKFVELALQQMDGYDNEKQVYRQVHDKSAAAGRSGMICSGEQTIFLYTFCNEDEAPLKNLLASLQANENGTLQLTQEGISFSNQPPIENFFFQKTSDDSFFYREKTGYKNILHIIGGGHCSLALSKLMTGLDFYIHVYDDRQNLLTMELNTFAHECHLLEDYSQLKIEEGNNVYVVIMSFGYRTDDLALRTLEGKAFHYLAVLGSRKKITTMMQAYQQEGLDATWLNSIHSPAGIQIKSQTPHEIAVSIAAEIIKEKNKNQ